jgi:molybdenum cofactor cytidylyltransferase
MPTFRTKPKNFNVSTFHAKVKKSNPLRKKRNIVISTAGLLLAAGRGARFDHTGKQNKLLAKYRNGVPVITYSALNLAHAVERRIAVIRPDADNLRKHLELAGYLVVECPDASLGMGHSLSWGVAEAMKAFDMQILIVALADMPQVMTSTMTILLDAARKTEDIVAPIYQSRRGNPVVFREKHFERLSRLSGDKGASQFIKDEKVTLIEVDDPGIHRDIDAPEDLID